MTTPDLHVERTNLWTVIVATAIAILGVLLLFAANWQWLASYPGIQAVVRELGGLLVASVALSILWELVAKRAFLAELMAKAKLGEDVRTAGLISIPKDFYRDIDWSYLFRNVEKLDVFIAYGGTWRGANRASILALAERPGAQVRIVLPDPDNDAIVSELARRFYKSNEAIRTRILEATDDFIGIFNNPPKTVADFSLWYTPTTPLFSLYRFDSISIITLHTHRSGRWNIPVFMVEKGGSIYEFIEQEFEAFVDGQHRFARQIFPKPEPQVA